MDHLRSMWEPYSDRAFGYVQEGTQTVSSAFSCLVPRGDWLTTYSRTSLIHDLIAGLLVASVLIPNAMAYSLLAGVAPIMGLYAALCGVFVGSLWGSSRHVVTGPVGIVSLLTITSIAGLASPNTAEFFTLAIALAVLKGLIQFGLGFFRLGFIMRLIPHSVLAGFATAGAIIIALSQVPSLLGYKIGTHTYVFQTVFDTVIHATHAHLPTVILGLTTIIVVVLAKRQFPRFPIALTLLTVTGLASYLFDFAGRGIALVGYIPSVLPTANLHVLTLSAAVSLCVQAFVISIVGFVETYAIARAIARTTKERIDPNQELVGQGLANMASGVFGGFPVSGSFSVSALNVSSGARTRIANVFAGIVVLLAIVFLAPFMFYLPKAVLAGIVIVAVSNLVSFSSLRDLARLSQSDGIIAGATFVFAFLLRPDQAIFIGIIVALALLIRRIMWVDVVEVGLDERTEIFHARSYSPDLHICPGVLAVRMDMSLMYANSERMVREVEKRLKEREARTGEVINKLVINCSGINFIDATGIEGFEELLNTMKERSITVAIIYPKHQPRNILATSGLMEKVTYLRSIEELRHFCSFVKC